MLKYCLLLITTTMMALPLPSLGQAINNENKAVSPHDPTLVVERTQMMQSLLNDMQKPNPPAEALQKLTKHLLALQTEVRDLADQLVACKAGKK